MYKGQAHYRSSWLVSAEQVMPTWQQPVVQAAAMAQHQCANRASVASTVATAWDLAASGAHGTSLCVCVCVCACLCVSVCVCVCVCVLSLIQWCSLRLK